MFLRAYRICSPDFINDEIKYLTTVFSSLGYHSRFIHKAHLKSRKSFYKSNNTNDNSEQQNRPNYLVIPPLVNNKSLQPIFSKLNIQIVNKNRNTLRQTFNNTHTHLQTHQLFISYPVNHVHQAI